MENENIESDLLENETNPVEDPESIPVLTPDVLPNEEIVEEMTMYRLTLPAFHAMSEAHQERVRKAICAQIEYLDANGGSDMDNGADLQSAGLGKFNYAKSSGSDGNSKQSIYSPRAQRILFSTGLLYRGGRGL